jgi:hypothetical protein
MLFATPSAFAANELALCPQSTGDFNFSILCSLRPQNAFPTLLTFILILAVVIALAYLIWGGIKWIMSGGDKGNVETARNTIVAAIIGLIIVFLSWFIINFILTTFFGSGLGGGIDLPRVFTGSTPPTPTPVVVPSTETVITPTPTPAVSVEETSPIPPCPTAYPPDYICQMQEDQINSAP